MEALQGDRAIKKKAREEAGGRRMRGWREWTQRRTQINTNREPSYSKLVYYSALWYVIHCVYVYECVGGRVMYHGCITSWFSFMHRLEQAHWPWCKCYIFLSANRISGLNNTVRSWLMGVLLGWKLHLKVSYQVSYSHFWQSVGLNLKCLSQSWVSTVACAVNGILDDVTSECEGMTSLWMESCI